MLLTGTFPRTIDEQQRIAIPKRLREVFKTDENGGSAVFVAPGTDGSLGLYHEESFAQLAEQLGAASPHGQNVRAFSRLFFSQAQQLELDGQGRIRISPELLKHAGLVKEVMLVGVRDHLELWDRQRWEDYVNKQQEQYDQLAENAFLQNG